MRKTSANMDLLMQQRKVNGFTVVSVKGPNIDLKQAVYPNDVSIPSLGVFSANGSLLSLEPPIIANALDREVYKLSFADAGFSLRSAAQLGLVGSRVDAYMLLVNTMSYTLGGALPGMPLTGAADILVAFSGLVDTASYVVDPLEGTVSLMLECSSPMASLGLKKPYTTAKNNVQQLDVTDTAYDMVHVGSRVVSLVWGKK